MDKEFKDLEDAGKKLANALGDQFENQNKVNSAVAEGFKMTGEAFDKISVEVKIIRFAVIVILAFIFKDPVVNFLSYISDFYLSLSENWQIGIFATVVPIIATFFITRHFYKKK